MSSSRTRGLRELRPDLFLGTRRRRALRDSSPPILLRFLGALVRRQGQDWRACCDELRGKLRAAEKDRDEALRILESEREERRLLRLLGRDR